MPCSAVAAWPWSSIQWEAAARAISHLAPKTYADFELAVQQKCYICARSWTHFMPESLELLYYVLRSELYAIQEGGYGGLVLSSHLQMEGM